MICVGDRTRCLESRGDRTRCLESRHSPLPVGHWAKCFLSIHVRWYERHRASKRAPAARPSPQLQPNQLRNVRQPRRHRDAALRGQAVHPLPSIRSAGRRARQGLPSAFQGLRGSRAARRSVCPIAGRQCARHRERFRRRQRASRGTRTGWRHVRAESNNFSRRLARDLDARFIRGLDSLGSGKLHGPARPLPPRACAESRGLERLRSALLARCWPRALSGFD